MNDQEALYGLYKTARNRLRRYQPASVVSLVIATLHRVHASGTELLKNYQPWNVLLVMKWALQEGDATAHRRAVATQNDLNAVLNIVHDMEGAVRMPSDYEHVTLFMRHLAALSYARAQDADVRTEKFEFQQHLESLCKTQNRLPLLQTAFEKLCRRCIERVPEDQRGQLQ